MKFNFLFSLYLLSAVRSQTIELDYSFPESKGNDSWLVQFYAPWCGHCRKLAPVYHQVWLSLKNTPIKVAKIDATKYSDIAQMYDVMGFPTIKFFQGNHSYTYHGDRSRDDIIEFAKRAHGPVVRSIQSTDQFVKLTKEHSSFFVYVSLSTEKITPISVAFNHCARKLAIVSYFYQISNHILPKDISVSKESILVLKDSTHYHYEGPSESPFTDLELWMKHERFPMFPLLSRGGLAEMVDVDKYIVMVVTDSSDSNQAEHNRFKELGAKIAKVKRDQYHSKFQFAWMSDADTVNSITMSSLDTPSILVFDPITQYYFIPSVSSSQLNFNSFTQFLDDILQEKAPAYGGTGFLMRLKRLFYDLISTLWMFYKASGWLAILIMGLPCLVISIVCYAICCMEPAEDDRSWEDEEDDNAESSTLISPSNNIKTADVEELDSNEDHLKNE